MDKKVLSQIVIDCCNKWGVRVSLVDDNEFNDIFHHQTFFSKKERFI